MRIVMGSCKMRRLEKRDIYSRRAGRGGLWPKRRRGTETWDLNDDSDAKDNVH